MTDVAQMLKADITCLYGEMVDNTLNFFIQLDLSWDVNAGKQSFELIALLKWPFYKILKLKSSDVNAIHLVETIDKFYCLSVIAGYRLRNAQMCGLISVEGKGDISPGPAFEGLMKWLGFSAHYACVKQEMLCSMAKSWPHVAKETSKYWEQTPAGRIFSRSGWERLSVQLHYRNTSLGMPFPGVGTGFSTWVATIEPGRMTEDFIRAFFKSGFVESNWMYLVVRGYHVYRIFFCLVKPMSMEEINLFFRNRIQSWGGSSAAKVIDLIPVFPVFSNFFFIWSGFYMLPPVTTNKSKAKEEFLGKYYNVMSQYDRSRAKDFGVDMTSCQWLGTRGSHFFGSLNPTLVQTYRGPVTVCMLHNSFDVDFFSPSNATLGSLTRVGTNGGVAGKSCKSPYKIKLVFTDYGNDSSVYSDQWKPSKLLETLGLPGPEAIPDRWKPSKWLEAWGLSPNLKQPARMAAPKGMVGNDGLLDIFRVRACSDAPSFCLVPVGIPSATEREAANSLLEMAIATAFAADFMPGVLVLDDVQPATGPEPASAINAMPIDEEPVAAVSGAAVVDPPAVIEQTGGNATESESEEEQAVVMPVVKSEPDEQEPVAESAAEEEEQAVVMPVVKSEPDEQEPVAESAAEEEEQAVVMPVVKSEPEEQEPVAEFAAEGEEQAVVMPVVKSEPEQDNVDEFAAFLDASAMPVGESGSEQDHAEEFAALFDAAAMSVIKSEPEEEPDAAVVIPMVEPPPPPADDAVMTEQDPDGEGEEIDSAVGEASSVSFSVSTHRVKRKRRFSSLGIEGLTFGFKMAKATRAKFIYDALLDKEAFMDPDNLEYFEEKSLTAGFKQVLDELSFSRGKGQPMYTFTNCNAPVESQTRVYNARMAVMYTQHIAEVIVIEMEGKFSENKSRRIKNTPRDFSRLLELNGYLAIVLDKARRLEEKRLSVEAAEAY